MASRLAILRVFAYEEINEDISPLIVEEAVAEIGCKVIKSQENILYNAFDFMIGGKILPKVAPGAPLRIYRINELRELEVNNE